MIFLLKITSNIVDLDSRLLSIGFILLILSSVIWIYFTGPVVAQTPESRSIFSSSHLASPPFRLHHPKDGQQVPVGELTIEGISSDNAESDCQVYADLNDITPMQNATGSRR